MESVIIEVAGGALCALTGGIGLGLGARLVPVSLRANRDLRSWKRSDEAQAQKSFSSLKQEERRLAAPVGRKRDSNVVGFYRDVLRTKDGSYVRGYNLSLEPTMLAQEGVAESRVDELGRLLTSQDLPAGTVLQFRYSVGPDPGRSIAEHLRSRDYARTHLPAARLHDMKVDFYRDLAEQGAFRYERASLFVRVPAKHRDDNLNQGLSAFVPAALTNLRKGGIKHVPDAITAAKVSTASDGVVRRIREVEEALFERQEKVARTIELQSPLKLSRLSVDEMWETIFHSHVLDAHSLPGRPQAPGSDIRRVLCSQSVEARGSYVMHGNCPVAVISMFTPSDKFVFADSIRELTAHAHLTFRHTVVCEYVVMERSKAIKQIKKRMKGVDRSTTQSDGTKKVQGEAKAALSELEVVLDSIVGSRDALVQMRMYAVVYGEQAGNRAELKASLKTLDRNCDHLITAMQSIDGVTAGREEPASLSTLYPKTMIGECDASPTGREITEVANSLAAHIPAETAWGGSARPHTLISTVSGRLIGLNLWDKSQRSRIKSPLALVIAEPGGGKTTTCALLINDALSTLSGLRVCAVDVGRSLEPHAIVTGARYLVLNTSDKRSINIWDYPDLETGAMANDEDINMIVLDAMTLAHVKADDDLASDILTKAVTQVIKNFVPRNGPGKPKCEATHSHLVSMLETYDYGAQILNDRAKTLGLALEKYVGNAYLDVPTHPDFLLETPYDVFEIESLDDFPPDVRASLANRIAARVIRTAGKVSADGTRSPTLLVFTEVWKLVQQYPMMMRVIQKGARTGRRDNVVTVLDTQTYDDFAGIHDVTKTAGVKIIGKQNGDFSNLVRDAGLSPLAVSAIQAIKNIDGVHAQFVLVLGSGNDQTCEMIQVDLAPSELWTFTSNPDERNARARVSALRPRWSLLEVIGWLSETYPRGLVSQGLNAIDESLL